MKKGIMHALALLVLAGVVVGGFALWRVRPWRAVVTVNGHALTAGELDLRARTLMNDAIRVKSLVLAPGQEQEVLQRYRLEGAKKWVIKEVLLSEALARGYSLTPDDEKEALARVAAGLKSRKLTPEEFFKEGPIPEELKRRDFRESAIVGKFTDKEVADKIVVDKQEEETRFRELRRRATEHLKPGEKPKWLPSRKAMIDQIRGEQFRKGFRQLFRSLYPKYEVKSDEFPQLEKLDGISAPRPEDNEAKDAAK